MRRIPVFFYGLFMDEGLVRAKGVDPQNPRKASADGFAVRIGNRAALVPQAGAQAHGMLMDLTHEEIDRLYAEPSVSMYRPEPIMAGGAPALCFNLPEAPSADEFNAAYAEKLRDLKRRLGLPAE